MTFRLFIYYSAICGGWAAFLGWVIGRLLSPGGFAGAVVQGFLLGLLIALALGIVDAKWITGTGSLPRVGAAVLGGSLGGILSAVIGELLVEVSGMLAPVMQILGWTLTGLLIGISVSSYDLVGSLRTKGGATPSLRKVRNGLLGGASGGCVGGIIMVGLAAGLESLIRDRNFLSPTAIGLVILGLSIGLMIGLAQVILKEAWIKVETGFKAGRELILAKPEVTIGRAEGNDIGLFGDTTVERTHARILHQGAQYLLSDEGSSEGTYVNDQRVTQPVQLRDGDAIRIGKNVLRFGERGKKVGGTTKRR